MKLTAIILLTASLQLSARGVSQTLTISLKNASLEKVFSEIHKQTGYSFFYEDGLLKNAKPVDVSVVKATIAQVLDLCFANQPFTYKIVNNAVSVRKKEQTRQTSFQPALPLTGDPVTVSGKVTDEQGQPLSGANVKVKGTKVGTTTDIQGRFTLANLDANATLEVSFVGHDAQTFAIKGKGFLTIALVQKQSILDETVIIAYGTSSRRFTTGNIATVKAADIEKAPVQNPLLALQGRVTGVEIKQLTGMNGGGVTVQIQGQNSIGNSNNPLIVVDGVPYPFQLTGASSNPQSIEAIVQGGSPLNYINPNDIESIDVLKDADATAIYGSRAANGAILITTKKGKAGKTRLSLNAQQGWGKVNHKLDILNTRQYLDMRYEAFKNDGIPLSTLNTNSNYDLTVWDTTRYTDWQKELIGKAAHYTNLNASFSGGTSTLQYLVGTSYNHQTTVFPGDFDDKVGNLHFSVNGNSVNQKFKLQLTGTYVYDQNHLPNQDLTQQAILLEPVAPPLYNDDGTLNWATNAAGRSTWTNPVAYTKSTDFFNTTKNLVSNAIIGYNIMRGLDLRTNIGYTNTQSNIYTPTRLDVTPPEQRPTTQRIASFGNRNMESWIIEPQLLFADKIGKGKIDALLATSIQKSSYTYLRIDASGFLTDLLMKTLRAATAMSINQSTSGITRYNALFGRLNYNWDDKYLISLSARRDGSNKFGAKNRFHNFGSIGLAWIFSQEKWISSQLPILSFGKLRASYGTTGNDGIPDFSYLSIYNINSPTILYEGSIGLNASNLPNPHIQWEETRKWQGGLDLGFIKDRVLIGVTLSRNRSSNQLLSFAIPTMAGFTSIIKNVPVTVQNINWEFSLNSVPIKSKDFELRTNINLTIPRNKLLSAIDPNSPSIGLPLGYIRVSHYAGLNPATGNYMLLDKNGNPIYSTSAIADQNVFLSNLSRYYGGLLNSITYKRFQLDFLFQFVRKMGPRDMYFYNGQYAPGSFSASSSNQPISVLSRWQKPGDIATVGRFRTGNVSVPVTSSDAWYSYDASYVRLKNVSLSWQVPDKWVKTLKFQNARVYAHAQNLATITKYTGLDPETMSISTLPPLRMITVGGQIDFYDMPSESDLFQIKFLNNYQCIDDEYDY